MTPRRFLVAALLLASCLLGCTKIERIVGPTITVTDTLVHVDTVPVLRVDTLVTVHVDTIATVRVDTAFVPRTDTLTRVDTVIRVDTLASPPVHDTTIVAHVDTVTLVDTVTREVHDTTFVPRTDTLLVPEPVVHDTTWLYTQTNPTNPFAGGDPTSGLLVLQIYSTYDLVFWHGHFMGVLMQGTGYWNAYGIPTDGSMLMPLFCTKATWREAAGCLEPLVLTLTPVRVGTAQSTTGGPSPVSGYPMKHSPSYAATARAMRRIARRHGPLGLASVDQRVTGWKGHVVRRDPREYQRQTSVGIARCPCCTHWRDERAAVACSTCGVFSVSSSQD